MPENRSIRQIRAAVHGLGKYRVHSSLTDIAETLLDRWPEEHKYTADHKRAVLICHDCLADAKLPAEDARDAFIVALDAAGISVMLEDLMPRYRVPLIDPEPSANARSKGSKRRGRSPVA